MVRPEVVAYLQAHLKKHPIDELRRQLAAEGVSSVDFDDALKSAMRAPSTLTTGTAAGRTAPSRASLVFLVLGVAVVAALTAWLALRREPEEAPSASTTVVSATGESAFVGHTGYVIRLPKGYEAAAAFKDEAKAVEVVHFCRGGTDPTNFVHRGLYGQMGIVRLDVQPNPWSGDMLGPDRLARALNAERTARGDKFAMKNIQVSSLRGVQIQTELPDISVEAYILGEAVMYHFFAGQEDEIFRSIVDSLRDPHAETL
ncbi:MAG: hypothetical protein PHU21_01470 [Elusimicrobia bacterium]|nr:hypothetical protein [Elusimicrobiota bacterium]